MVQENRVRTKKANLGILIITKENVKAPWLYFEAGALVGNSLEVIPLLVNCDHQSLENSPIISKQCVQFYVEKQFFKMLDDIKSKYKFLRGLSDEETKNRYKRSYINIRKHLENEMEEMKKERYFSERYIYPQDINTMTMNTVYISAPMSSITLEDFRKNKLFLITLKKMLIEDQMFDNVICPAIERDEEDWSGITTAVKTNYRNLRRIQHLIVFYPKHIPTSSLLEIGYGIALCKNIIIFYKDELPYMLKGAAEDIPHLHTRKFVNNEDIIKAIKSDKGLFEVKRNE